MRSITLIARAHCLAWELKGLRVFEYNHTYWFDFVNYFGLWEGVHFVSNKINSYCHVILLDWGFTLPLNINWKYRLSDTDDSIEIFLHFEIVVLVCSVLRNAFSLLSTHQACELQYLSHFCHDVFTYSLVSAAFAILTIWSIFTCRHDSLLRTREITCAAAYCEICNSYKLTTYGIVHSCNLKRPIQGFLRTVMQY